ncbi:branched-chain amino acid ABC transporter permease [Limisalsivibrio acetivorans]|uniref:branched-chain amino acid ABC transporter permease n=1 Tax=Limisalsivibrio acetivorans TaxID=1304888 RepID=UPI0003B538ED|nr:branched-chain amino acid ABC transporter permease [Limisalsivibrio acetivorans]
MNYVNCGNFKTSYTKDAEVYQTKFSKALIWGFVIALFGLPFLLGPYLLYVMNLIFIAVIGAVGLNILTGYTGLISLGQGAFMGVGAYAAGYFSLRWGIPFYLAIPMAGLTTAVFGAFFGIPSLRLKGLYLSIATLAAQFIIEFLFIRLEPITGGVTGLSIDYANFFGIEIYDDFRFYFLSLTICILMTLAGMNMMRTKLGRAFLSIRDNYIAAEAMGISLFRYKLLSFAVSSFYAGVAGSLWAYYTTIITPENFTISVSIQYLSMIIIGGLGSIQGAIFGAAFIVVLPEFLQSISDWAGSYYPAMTQIIGSIKEGVFGLVIILFLVFEPEGLVRRWRLIKAYWKLWPFSY